MRTCGCSADSLGPLSAAWQASCPSAQAVRLATVPSEDLPVAEFAFPGPLRDRLVAAIVAGATTTRSGLVADYEHENEPLPRPGLRQVVVDSAKAIRSR